MPDMVQSLLGEKDMAVLLLWLCVLLVIAGDVSKTCMVAGGSDPIFDRKS